VGGTRTFGVDVRIIAATNRNLRAEVKKGGFRQDLYYLLAQAQVVSPPLRDREGDIELLVEHFLSKESPPGRIDEVPEDVWEMFRKHRWPGNVRELRNAVHRLALTPDRVLPTTLTGVGFEGAGGGFDPSQPLPQLSLARRDASDAFELGYVRRALELAGQNVPRAADLAGISRQMMLRLARKHGLK
jgi:transcriptional regulator with PAS, ATPase and Fis domain